MVANTPQGRDFTIRNLPPELDAALRERATLEHRPVDDLVVDLLRLAIAPAAPKKRDLSHLAGKWVEDPECDAALEEQRRIDPEIWK